MTGFFEESKGVRSMTRLALGWLLLLASLVVGTACWYVLHCKPEASILLALVSMLTVLVVKGIFAIKNRNAPDDPK